MPPDTRVADLHLHSTASDGSDTPATVVRRAKAAGFGVIALADHDTMDGVPEALAAAAAEGVELIPAVEYSTLDGEREIHMLGYGLDPDDAELRRELRRLAAGRFDRAQLMVEKLNEAGVLIQWERVKEIAGDDNVGRPHVARAMQEAGYITEIKEAFTAEYIASGGRCYVERVKITPEESIAQIRAAGGIAVLAHPGRFRADDDTIGDEVIERYIDAGLEGIEVFYARHTEAMVAHYRALAERYGLVMTGGSDDHGANAEEGLLGRVRLPYEYVERLREAIDRSRVRRNAGAAHSRA
ncbi:MAG TPA: PHP domain-containing protein [Gemmatimonadaceae bacterium]|nr:PHP domain-containing protein [Gemmatimonadaceae bacterium]